MEEEQQRKRRLPEQLQNLRLVWLFARGVATTVGAEFAVILGTVILVLLLLTFLIVTGIIPGAPGAPGAPGIEQPQRPDEKTMTVQPVILDGKHACPALATYVRFPGDRNAKQGEYSYVCGHCLPIFNANDVVVYLEGGTPVVAVVDGRIDNMTNPVGGPALWLIGDDGFNYYYAHLRREGLVTGKVTAGQTIGYIAAGSENAIAKNNGVAHVHFSAGTPGNRQSFDDPANVAAGRFLDIWCGNNVCNGRTNEAYSCKG